MAGEIEILARGPWAADRVRSTWLSEPYVYPPAAQAEADAALAALAERGSPSHEGVSARLASFDASGDALAVGLQSSPWSARLLSDKHGSFAVVCLVRSRDGRWLAGRRAPWLAIWPGVWMLGGAGGVDQGEDVVTALRREVVEEWSVEPEDVAVEAIVRLSDGMQWLVGSATLANDAEVVSDEEHDDWAWWPADPAAWPDVEVRPELKALAALVSSEAA